MQALIGNMLPRKPHGFIQVWQGTTQLTRVGPGLETLTICWGGKAHGYVVQLNLLRWHCKVPGQWNINHNHSQKRWSALVISMEKVHYWRTTVWPFTYGILLAFTYKWRNRLQEVVELAWCILGQEKIQAKSDMKSLLIHYFVLSIQGVLWAFKTQKYCVK